jgi:hypothetical protein
MRHIFKQSQPGERNHSFKQFKFSERNTSRISVDTNNNNNNNNNNNKGPMGMGEVVPL